MKVRIVKIIILFLYIFLCQKIYAIETSPLQRFAIIIGSNYGGNDRVNLKYAVTDAASVSRIFKELGGLKEENTILLKEPKREGIINAFNDLNSIINSNKSSRRRECIFYYSGHSDRTGLILNGGQITYLELKEKIKNLSADVKIAILDSCSSGLFVRLKGGERLQPFLVDTAVNLNGYAFLSSSSDTEASQESDQIRGSFFTYCLISGLRGAADMDGNGRVTLNEAYQYSCKETQSITRNYKTGPQNPGYDIQMKGTGDLVLTDIHNSSSALLINKEITGRIFIYDSTASLIAKLDKKNDNLTLGLIPGEYNITWDNNGIFFQAKALLEDKQFAELNSDNFSLINNEVVGNSQKLIQGISIFLQPFYSVIYGDLQEDMEPDAGIQITGDFFIRDITLNPVFITGFQTNNADNLNAYYCAAGFAYQFNLYKKFDLLMFAAGGFSAGKFDLKQDNPSDKKISYSQPIILPGININYNLNNKFLLSLSLQTKFFIDPSIIFGTLDILAGAGYRI